MSDLNGAPITGAETTMESKSTWSSTSSAETELDNFWHDSVGPLSRGGLFFFRINGLRQADHAHSLCRTTFTLLKTLP